MTVLRQRFSTPALYIRELERISKRWEQPAERDYTVSREDLPKSYGRFTEPSRGETANDVP